MIKKRKKIGFFHLSERVVIVLLLVGLCTNLMAGLTVYAAETGTAYIATATPYYAHPATGEIEDSGNNEAIGQGMTESVTESTALIEQLDSGSMYATIRLSMMDNISNIRFWVQEWGGSGWSSVSSSIMQENSGSDYTTDFRIPIPNENAVVKVCFYVTPMGRDITYFVCFSNFTEGSGDFIVSVDTSSDDATTTLTNEVESQTQTTDTSQTTSTQNTTTSTNSNQVVEASTTNSSNVSTDATKKTAAQLIEEADGLVLSDDTLLTEASETNDTETEVEETKDSQILPALSWVLVLQIVIILTIPGVMAGLVLFLVITLQRRKERDDI